MTLQTDHLAEHLPGRAIFPNEPIYGLTVENYHNMINAGVFADDERVELLEGALVCKMSKNRPHVLATEFVYRELQLIVPAGYHLVRQEPITLNDSEPEPDLSLIQEAFEDYTERHPGPDECLLAVEVSDSSLKIDRGTKLRVYARAGIAIYWIVNLVDRLIEVYTEPDSSSPLPTYRTMASFRSGQNVPVNIRGVTVGQVAIDKVLPKK